MLDPNYRITNLLLIHHRWYTWYNEQYYTTSKTIGHWWDNPMKSWLGIICKLAASSVRPRNVCSPDCETSTRGVFQWNSEWRCSTSQNMGRKAVPLCGFGQTILFHNCKEYVDYLAVMRNFPRMTTLQEITYKKSRRDSRKHLYQK